MGESAKVRNGAESSRGSGCFAMVYRWYTESHITIQKLHDEEAQSRHQAVAPLW